jgi:hypothetical protein
MQPGKEAIIVLDESLTLKNPPPLIELEALAGKAVALLVCRAESVSATIFRKPKGDSYWISLMGGDKQDILGLFQLKRCAPVVDFEIVNRTVSDLVSTE